MSQELYIYWRIGATPLTQALQATDAFQRLLCSQHPGLTARVLHRAAGTDKATVMEIYTQPGGVGDALAQDIEAVAARALAVLPEPPQRHRERFEAHCANGPG